MRESERQALWLSWQTFANATRTQIEIEAGNFLASLKEAACVELQRSAARFATMGKNDEAIYVSLANLMDVYRHVAALPTVENPLMHGIIEVLTARVDEFDEKRENDHNPIAAEKQHILQARAELLREQLADIECDPLAYNLNKIGTLSENLTSEFLPKIYPHFQKNLRLALAELGNLHTRTVAAQFTDLLAREWEELGNIIIVQVAALENASQDATVHEVLNILREAYQHLGPIVAETQKILDTPRRDGDGITLAEFSQAINIAPVNIIVPESDFVALLTAEVEALPLLDNFKTDFDQATYQTQHAINIDKLLADGITQVFENLRPSLGQIPYEGETQQAILKGIEETVAIKIDSLHDSISQFEADATQLMTKFAEERPAISDAERKQLAATACTAWLNSPPCDADTFFTQILTNDQLNIKHRVDKQISNLAEKAEKFLFRFKKDVLLYEVCTYEEILTHSAARLPDAAALFAAHAELEMLLKNNNITPISPAPHEPFNAFEHEVLVAEKQDGFNKGEIIKVINTGYRGADKVIVRANVIAAR